MLGDWRCFLEKHLPFLLLLFWMALLWLFFVMYIFNILPFLPCISSCSITALCNQGQRRCWATLCVSLAPRPAGWEGSVWIYILSSLRAPWGTNYDYLHCAVAKHILELPISPRDMCIDMCMCDSWGQNYEVGSLLVGPKPSFLKSFLCPQLRGPFYFFSGSVFVLCSIKTHF